MATSNHKTPAYRLTVDGTDITPTVNARLVQLTLTEQRGTEADTLTLTLDDSDGTMALPPTRATISLHIGWQGEQLTDKGTYLVDEVTHQGAPDKITIRARAADLTSGLRNRRDQSWHQTTVGSIITTIAKRHSLTPRVHAKLASVAVQHIDQTNESDINFVTRLARHHDAVATIKAAHLLFLPMGKGVTASGNSLPLITINRSHGDNHSYTTADREHYSGVIAYWHDTNKARRTGELVGKRDNAKRLKDTYPGKRQAQEAAQAEWQRLKREGATLTLDLAMGQQDLVPESPVQVVGFKKEIDGTGWRTKGVTTNIGDGGYTQSIELELNAPD